MFLGKVSCESSGGTDKLLDYKTGQQSKTRDSGHSDNLYIYLKLDEILETIKEESKPCALPADEEKLEKVLRELRDVKEEFNENRQYINSKYHELRQDVNDIYDNTNAKHHDLRQDLNDMDGKVQQLKQSVKEGSKISGTTYIRWGRTTCPNNGSEETYTGYAGGSWYDHTGAAASMLCLPEDPDWDLGKYNDASESFAFVYGSEYDEKTERSGRLIGNSHHQQNVPCVVCNIRSRSSYIMVPGKTKCPDGWTMEYCGYLMSGYYAHKRASDYFCIDMEPEDAKGGEKNENGYVLYFVESRCGSLSCPPYVNGRELPCVVCTK